MLPIGKCYLAVCQLQQFVTNKQAHLGDEMPPCASLYPGYSVSEEGSRHQKGALNQDEEGLLGQQFGHASAKSAFCSPHAEPEIPEQRLIQAI